MTLSTHNGSLNSASASRAHALAALAGRALLAPRAAARDLIASGISPDALTRLMDYAHVTEAEVASFEREGTCYLLSLPGIGRVWFAPPGKRRVLLPPAPTLSPRGLRALALGLVDEILQ